VEDLNPQHPYDISRVPKCPNDLLARIYKAFQSRQYEIDIHAFERMNQRNVSPRDIPHIVLNGAPIEYDAVDTKKNRVPGVLFNGETSGGRPLHVKVTEELRRDKHKHYVVTVYEPNEATFYDGFSKRRTRT